MYLCMNMCMHTQTPTGSILKLLIEDQKQKPDNDRIDGEA